MIRAHDLGLKGEDNILSALSEYELDGVQLVVYKSIDSVEYKRGSLTGQTAKRIGEAFKSGGKDIALLGAYFNPVHPNEEKRRLGFDIFAEYLSLGSSFGATAVGSETGSCMGDPWGYHPDNASDAALALAKDSFSRLCALGEKYGMNIALEGAYSHVCSTPRRLYSMAEMIGKENIRFIIDLYNYLDISNYKEAYSIFEEAISLFGDRILLYHIKDFTVGDSKLCQCGVGKGILDLEKILKAVYKQNKDATLVLEGTTGEDIVPAVTQLKEIINKFD